MDGIRTPGRKMVDAGESTRLWRSASILSFWSRSFIEILRYFNFEAFWLLENLRIQSDCLKFSAAYNSPKNIYRIESCLLICLNLFVSFCKCFVVYFASKSMKRKQSSARNGRITKTNHTFYHKHNLWSKISLGVVVALLVEWSPPIPEIRSSNPIIGKFIKSLLIFNLQLKIILNLALDCEEDKNT